MFRPIAGLTFAWAVFSLTAAELKIDFNDFKLNETPRGFRSTVTASGKPGEWKIIEDEVPSPFQKISTNAPNFSKRGVLAQLARDRTDSHYPLLIYEGEVFKDFTVTTRFKIVDGAEEQMAGVAFRIQDEKNYYYVRASALGNSFYFFKFINGDLIGPIGSKVEITKGVWHELTVECKGSQVICSFDGKVIIPEMRQDNFVKGKIGLWTKSDAVSYFADLRVSYARVERLAQALVKETMKNHPRLLGIKIFGPVATNATELRMIASSDENEIGQPAERVEQDVMARGSIYYGKGRQSVVVTMPLHDRNGDRVAAARVVLRGFAGQTEQNAIVRATPIVKQMQARIQNAKDLIE